MDDLRARCVARVLFEQGPTGVGYFHRRNPKGSLGWRKYPFKAFNLLYFCILWASLTLPDYDFPSFFTIPSGRYRGARSDCSRTLQKH